MPPVPYSKFPCPPGLFQFLYFMLLTPQSIPWPGPQPPGHAATEKFWKIKLPLLLFFCFDKHSDLLLVYNSWDLLDLVLKFFIQDTMNVLINVSQSSLGSTSAAEGQGPWGKCCHLTSLLSPQQSLLCPSRVFLSQEFSRSSSPHLTFPGFTGW